MLIIERWKKEYRDDFIRLNREWIERYFRLEECDLDIFRDPQTRIVDRGGEIFFAVDDGRVVGCCALIFHPENGKYELAKMAVSPQMQGRGIGYRLICALLGYARNEHIHSVFLEANTSMKASVALYRKVGFKAVECPNPAYDRCDLCMEIILCDD